MNITYQVKGTDALCRALQKLADDAPRACGAALRAEGEKIASTARTEVPVDMGTLRTSTRAETPKTTQSEATVVIGSGGAAAPYAEWVHEGAGPLVGHGTWVPPWRALEGWAARHGFGTDEKSLRALAFAIGQKGFKPRKYLEKPFNAAQDGMADRLAKRLQTWLERREGVRYVGSQVSRVT